MASAVLTLAPVLTPSVAEADSAQVVTTCGTPNGTYSVGQTMPSTQDTNGKGCVNAAVTASITGFRPTNFGTPISVTTGGVTGTLPTNTGEVVATNVGATNGAYCALGASATTSSQYIAPNGGWFAFAISGDTQLTCITATSTTTVNMAGGSGVPTGTGGGGGGSSANASVGSTGGAVPASGTYVGMNVAGNLTGMTGTANGLKVDGSAVTQPVSESSATVATSAVGVTSQVVKASAGTLYSFEVEADSTLAGSAWYVMFFNSTTVPASGTVAPFKCYWVPASTQQTGGTFATGGIAFTTGIVEVVSSAGCGTYTPSAHATLSADYQ